MSIESEIQRFQDLSRLSPPNKSSSYQISITKTLYDDMVEIEWGCYDVGDYPRHYHTSCKLEDLERHMQGEIDLMYYAVALDTDEL